MEIWMRSEQGQTLAWELVAGQNAWAMSLLPQEGYADFYRSDGLGV